MGSKTKPSYIIHEELVSDMLNHLDLLKFVVPRVLKELAEVFAESLSKTYRQCWLTRKVPDDWRLANVKAFSYRITAFSYRKGLLMAWKDELSSW